MKATVILAHPFSKSFNHAIFQTIVRRLISKNVTTFSHDLYAENFNPVLSVEELGKKKSEDELVGKYAQELIESDLLFFIHPNWWGQPPAILKGYIDRVIRPPYSYDFLPEDNGGGLPIGKLSGKYGIVFNTSNTEESREETCFKDPLDTIWKNCVFGFCGIEKYYRKIFRIIADSDDFQRKVWLSEVEEIVDRVIQNC